MYIFSYDISKALFFQLKSIKKESVIIDKLFHTPVYYSIYSIYAVAGAAPSGIESFNEGSYSITGFSFCAFSSSAANE